MSRINNNQANQPRPVQKNNNRPPTQAQTQKSGESAFASRFQKKTPGNKQQTPGSTNNRGSSTLTTSAKSESNPSSMMMQRHGAPVLGRRGGNTVADLQAKLQVQGEGGGNSGKLGAMAGAEGAAGAEGIGMAGAGEGKGLGKEMDLDNLLTSKDGDTGAVNNDLAGAAGSQNPLQSGVSALKGAMSVEVQGNRIPTAMLDKIVDQARVGVNEAGAPEFQFDLKGDVLGGMKMRMTMDEGQLKAIFIAENPEVRKLIDGNLKDLQRHLEDRGIHVRDLEVRDPEEDRRQRQRDQNQKDREQAMG